MTSALLSIILFSVSFYSILLHWRNVVCEALTWFHNLLIGHSVQFQSPGSCSLCDYILLIDGVGETLGWSSQLQKLGGAVTDRDACTPAVLTASLWVPSCALWQEEKAGRIRCPFTVEKASLCNLWKWTRDSCRLVKAMHAMCIWDTLALILLHPWVGNVLCLPSRVMTTYLHGRRPFLPQTLSLRSCVASDKHCAATFLWKTKFWFICLRFPLLSTPYPMP